MTGAVAPDGYHDLAGACRRALGSAKGFENWLARRQNTIPTTSSTSTSTSTATTTTNNNNTITTFTTMTTIIRLLVPKTKMA